MLSEDALAEVGERGRYQQLLLWLVLLPSQLPFGSQGYCQFLMSWTPDHWCKIPEIESEPVNASVYMNLRIYLAREYKDRELLFEQCTVNRTVYGQGLYQQLGYWIAWNSSALYHCDANGWYYNKSLLNEDNTVVTAWDLVCDRNWLATLALTMFGLGEFLSLPLWFYVTYRHGQRVSFFLFLAAQCLFGSLTAASPNIACYSLLRFFVGLATPATIATPTSLAQELVGTKFRGWTIQFCYLFRSIGGVILAASVLVIRDWPQIALASAAPFVAFFLYWWVLPESPQWLLARGRFEETLRLLRTVAEVNKKDLTPDYIVSAKRRFQLERSLSCYRPHPETHFETIKNLFRPAAFRKRTTVIIFCWITSTASFLGLNYFCLELHGDVYLNFLLSAISELIGWIVATAMLRCCSRRCCYCVTCALGGVLCVTMATRKRGKSASLTLYVSTKLSISISYFVLPMWTAELLPNNLRGSAFNLSELLTMACPFLLPLLMYQGRTIHALPMVLIGVMQLLGGLVALGLPETRLSNFLNPPKQVEMEQCDNPWSCNCGPYDTLKVDPRNGILRSSGPNPPSPIFSLLRCQERRMTATSHETSTSVEMGTSNPIDRHLSMDELKVTVL